LHCSSFIASCQQTPARAAIALNGHGHIAAVGKLGDGGDLLRFMRESGDPELLAEYEKAEDRRFEQEQSLLAMLEESGRRNEGLSRRRRLRSCGPCREPNCTTSSSLDDTGPAHATSSGSGTP
jgi:hypothetical protein